MDAAGEGAGTATGRKRLTEELTCVSAQPGGTQTTGRRRPGLGQGPGRGGQRGESGGHLEYSQQENKLKKN